MPYKPKQFKVTKTNKVEVTDLIPGDHIEDKEQKSGVIWKVEGTTKSGLLTWKITLQASHFVNTYIFKLIKA